MADIAEWHVEQMQEPDFNEGWEEAVAVANANRTKDNRRAMPPKRKPQSDDPRGQLGAYLRHLADKRAQSESREEVENEMAESFGISRRTLRAWFTGRIGPTLGDLDMVAAALGFDDWGKLGNAVSLFHRKKK